MNGSHRAGPVSSAQFYLERNLAPAAGEANRNEFWEGNGYQVTVGRETVRLWLRGAGLV